MEIVPESVTLGKIHQEFGLSGTLREDTLEKWFHERNKTKEQYEKVEMSFNLTIYCCVLYVAAVCLIMCCVCRL